ncbi:MAG: hypothetical protein N2Z64_05150 [Dictyoglomus thermophilum]|nr:hypothetical protein [Dictyoglomus thermophilum]MCX7720653.1 hypothetical protein [Dictyoglomus thermophilum]
MRKTIFITLLILILIIFTSLYYLRYQKYSLINNLNIIDLTNIEFSNKEIQIDNKEILNNLTNLCILIDWSNRIIGGFFKENWINADKIVEIFNGMKFKFKLYNIGIFLGEYEGFIPERKEKYINLLPSDEKIYNSQIGISCVWDPLVRIPIVEDNIEIEAKVIRKILKDKNLGDITIKIGKKIIIDLDNDGNKDIIFEVSNITTKDIEYFSENSGIKEEEFNKKVKKDKYSLILLREIKNGKQNDYILGYDYNSLNKNEVIFIADIDNDKIMELGINCICVDAIPDEGYAVGTYKIFKKTNDKINQVAEKFWIPDF